MPRGEMANVQYEQNFIYKFNFVAGRYTIKNTKQKHFI